MPIRVCLSLALLMALPVWSQVAPDASGGNVEDTAMNIPPPVSDEAYPTATGDETKSNYLRAGFTMNTAYDDNVLPDYGSAPIGSMIYSIRPTLTIDQMTSRLHSTVTYSPGYTFYQNASALNEEDQNATLDFQYRMSPHVAFNINDAFVKSSNVFNQPYSALGGPISGSSQSLPSGAIAPFADQLQNSLNGGLSYQISMSAMIGGSGTTTKLIYPNLAEVPGLYNSNSYGGSVFYNRRLTISQYTGMVYQYSQYIAAPGATQSEIQTHTINFFYTYYWSQAFSLSLSGGPQYYNAAVWPFPSYSAWTPSIMASLAWQRNRANVIGSYSRTVTGGGGLLGAYHTNTAFASVRWQISRNWTVSPTASYYSYKTVNALFASSGPPGHTVSEAFLAERSFGRHITAAFEYEHLHLSYGTIAVLSATPDSNCESVSVTYHFEKPLGK